MLNKLANFIQSEWIDIRSCNLGAATRTGTLDTDRRALSPLLTSHINPYGQIVLNMDKRIAFGG